jgi:hypothetical protein
MCKVQFCLPGQQVKKHVARGTQATTLQLTPATEGRTSKRGRGPTVPTPSFRCLSRTACPFVDRHDSFSLCDLTTTQLARTVKPTRPTAVWWVNSRQLTGAHFILLAAAGWLREHYRTVAGETSTIARQQGMGRVGACSGYVCESSGLALAIFGCDF